MPTRTNVSRPARTRSPYRRTPRRLEKQITVIRADAVLPGMAYPYLPVAWDWTIYSTPLAKLEELDRAYPDRESPPFV